MNAENEINRNKLSRRSMLLAGTPLSHPVIIEPVYDKSGRVTGEARTEGGVTTYYDVAGRVTGKSEVTGRRRAP
jgi:hypothetical protein